MSYAIHTGDCVAVLRAMDANSAHCCVTSPPYYGLRDYGHKDQIGLEETPEQYVAKLVEVFREVRRVLRDDGTLWLNLGDSYSTESKWGGSTGGKAAAGLHGLSGGGRVKARHGIPDKNLLGIPWRVAFALQADGWYLRQDIIWSKPNPMPESVRDRCTKSHEYLFLLSKSPRYYFNAEAIAEPLAESSVMRLAQPTLQQQAGSKRVPGKTNGAMKAVGPRFGGRKYGDDSREESRTKSGKEWNGSNTGMRNRRSVWSVTTQPFKAAHFATFPPALIEPCILAGCPENGTVLDPFGGAATTALVAEGLGRDSVLIELNPDYAALGFDRLLQYTKKAKAA